MEGYQSLVWLLLSAGVVLIGFFAVFIKVGRQNESLNNANEALAAINEKLSDDKEKAVKDSSMKSRFVQNVSHDFRTPLNAIVGFSQLLALPDGSLTQQEKEEYLEYVTNSADHLMMLVDDILSMSDIENGIYTIKKVDMQCNEVCRMAIRCSQFRVQSGVKMYMTTEVDDSYTINNDPHRVQQILLNYLSNACKHTMTGEIRLHVSVSENPGKVTFSVTDTGTGVDPAIAKTLFTRYATTGNGGHGMGLDICTSVAAQIGGEVSYDSSYSGGARFILIV